MNKLREKIFAWILKRQPVRRVVVPQWNNVRTVGTCMNILQCRNPAGFKSGPPHGDAFG